MKYIGVEIIDAVEMTAGEAGLTRVGFGGDTPVNDDGYLVTDENGNKRWLTKTDFERVCRKSKALTFGYAVEAMKLGYTVTRNDWGSGLLDLTGNYFSLLSHGARTIGWTPTAADMLADDWGIVE